MGFDGWWHCTKCEARGPGLNNKFCTSYTHKRWKGTRSDRSDQDDDDDYPEWWKTIRIISSRHKKRLRLSGKGKYKDEQ
eukprot:11392851-Heterocapsa_arctica.AAC.1